MAIFMVASVCSAQSLDEIVNKYYAASGIEHLEKAQTAVLKGNVSMMGMDLPMTVMVKRPNKIRVVQEFSGMEIIMTYDGEKGFMINPLSGITTPTELPLDQVSGVLEQNVLDDQLMAAFRAGKATLSGEESVDGKPAYKITVQSPGGNEVILFIDKGSFLIVKTMVTTEQMGQVMEVETYVRKYKVINGVTFGSEVAQYISGQEFGGMTIETIEFDKPLDDSLFWL